MALVTVAVLVSVCGYAADPAVKSYCDLRLRTDYDYRKQGDEKDSDIYGYLYGSGHDLLNGNLDFYVSGRLSRDLDKPSTVSVADDMYLSVADMRHAAENRLLQAYIDAHDRDRNMRLRAGRQYVDVADYLLIDGALTTFNENGRLGFGIYSGTPVSFYDSISGDRAGGLFLTGRPWDGNRTRISYARYIADGGVWDYNYAFDSEQALSDSIRLAARASMLNDDFRMASLDGYYISPDGKTDFLLGGSRWGEFTAETRAFSPIFSVLGEQRPYTYGYAKLTQQIIPSILISPGISYRWVDSGDEDFGNRTYKDYNVTLIFEPVRAFSSSISVDYWNVEKKDKFLGLSGDVRYRYQRRWEVSVGAAYASYTYDTYSDISYSVNGGQEIFSENGTVITQTPEVLTYYFRAKWNVSKNLILKIQGTVEDDSNAGNETSALGFSGRGSVEVRL
ncbi:MAG: hypothetical protein C0404_01445 [Verrucomicrobia bacterium]|nr:hypothetical protein [Verrucomicrobiota bacterium]